MSALALKSDIDLEFPKKIQPFFRPKRHKIAVGGRGSAKSQSFATMLCLEVMKGKKALCAREFQNSLEDSVYSLIIETIDNYGFSGWEIQANALYHASGGEIKFKGLARNPHSIKSMFGFDIVWVEEAQTLSALSLQLLLPTIREANSEIWMTANPQSRQDPFSQRFIVPFEQTLLSTNLVDDELHTVVRINFPDNPWFPDELEKQRAHDKEHMTAALYDHIWGGAFNDSVERALISAEWFDACVDAHLKLGFEPEGARIASHDPADVGNDAKTVALRHGVVFTNLTILDAENANIASDMACDFAQFHRANGYIWDCDGMGAVLRQQVAKKFKGTQCKAIMFKGSEGVHLPEQVFQGADTFHGSANMKNKDVFRNKRAQNYSLLADRMRKTYEAVSSGRYVDPETLVSFSGDIAELDTLRSELCRLPIKPSNTGRIELYSKEEMRKGITQADGTKLILPSPNCFVSGTMVATKNGPRRIEELSIGDSVSTPMGEQEIAYKHKNTAHNIKKVILSNGTTLTATDNHRIYTDGVRSVKIKDLKIGQKVYVKTWKKSLLLWLIKKLGTGEKHLQYKAHANITSRTVNYSLKDFYIAMYGYVKKAKFRKG